jgi:hypothetical protein
VCPIAADEVEATEDLGGIDEEAPIAVTSPLGVGENELQAPEPVLEFDIEITQPENEDVDNLSHIREESSDEEIELESDPTSGRPKKRSKTTETQ